MKERRTVANDNTLSYRGKIYQLLPSPHRKHFVKARVEVRQRPDGKIKIVHPQAGELPFLPIREKPSRLRRRSVVESSRRFSGPTARAPEASVPRQGSAESLLLFLAFMLSWIKTRSLLRRGTFSLCEHPDIFSACQHDNVHFASFRFIHRSSLPALYTVISRGEASQGILAQRVIYKRYRDLLGSIHFRLDTVVSKTQVLRDLVYCRVDLGVLNGLILLLDELEKMDNTTSKFTVLRFLSGIRALIDSLQKYLFLMAAITPNALRRYFAMLPAFAGRLQNRIELPYLKDEKGAHQLYLFYLNESQDKAKRKLGSLSTNFRKIIGENEASEVFDKCFKEAQEKSGEGVCQRVFYK